MIVQWENECISLSAHSVAWIMIAQCENECILLSVLIEVETLWVGFLYITSVSESIEVILLT